MFKRVLKCRIEVVARHEVIIGAWLSMRLEKSYSTVSSVNITVGFKTP